MSAAERETVEREKLLSLSVRSVEQRSGSYVTGHMSAAVQYGSVCSVSVSLRAARNAGQRSTNAAQNKSPP